MRVSMVQGERGAYEATLKLLARRSPPDTIFVTAARFIRAVQRAAHEAGREVPESLMLAAGVDGIHAREGKPPVTAWDLHPERQAEEAIEMLLGRLAGETGATSRYVAATPHLRASTGC